jgi:ornithine cyclodeaminase
MMPAAAEGCVGVKLVSVVPANAKRNMPLVQGVMILSDAVSGRPVALMEAASLTALRTAAVGAVGVKHTTDAASDTVGIVGCGTQGVWQATFACAVRPVKELFVFNRSQGAIRSFTEQVSRNTPHVQITPCQSVDQLLSRTSIVITATSSSDPVLPNKSEQIAGKHFVSIGSFRPSMQELPDIVYQLSGQLIIDSEAALHEVGDVINPLKKGLVKPTDIFTLGPLIRGERAIDIARTTVFKSVGMALYDLFVAKALLDEAKRRGVGRDIDITGISA